MSTSLLVLISHYFNLICTLHRQSQEELKQKLNKALASSPLDDESLSKIINSFVENSRSRQQSVDFFFQKANDCLGMFRLLPNSISHF